MGFVFGTWHESLEHQVSQGQTQTLTACNRLHGGLEICSLQSDLLSRTSKPDPWLQDVAIKFIHWNGELAELRSLQHELVILSRLNVCCWVLPGVRS